MISELWHGFKKMQLKFSYKSKQSLYIAGRRCTKHKNLVHLNYRQQKLEISIFKADGVTWVTTLGERRDYHLAIWVYKCIRGYPPSYFNEIFVSTSRIHQHETRNYRGLYVPRPRTNILKRSFAYQGVLIWNSLPDHVRSACNLTIFKTKCKEFLVLS